MFNSAPPLVRIHSQCLTGDVFASMRCDCRQQLELALSMIADAGAGILIYEQQEGRGIGLMAKIQAYELQDKGLGHDRGQREAGLRRRLPSVHSARRNTEAIGGSRRAADLQQSRTRSLPWKMPASRSSSACLRRSSPTNTPRSICKPKKTAWATCSPACKNRAAGLTFSKPSVCSDLNSVPSSNCARFFTGRNSTATRARRNIDLARQRKSSAAPPNGGERSLHLPESAAR